MVTKVTDEAVAAIQEATGHSVYGGSSLPRIVACPGSVLESLRAGLKPESIYARKGSELHDLSEKAESSSDPRRYILSRNQLSIEDTSLLLDSHEYVEKIRAKHEGETTISLEANGSLKSWGLPEVYGTQDVRIESDQRIDVIDYKYGYGVPVYARENYQLSSYLAMGVPYEPDGVDKELYIHICQPPLQIFDEWFVPYERLCEMILGDITTAITKSRLPNPPYSAGEKQCRFCGGNLICKARKQWLGQQSKAILAVSQNPGNASVEQWSTFLASFNALQQAAKNAIDFAEQELLAGREFPGYKLVQKRSTRKFKDADEGEKFIKARLGDRAYKTKELPIITLAQAEKIDPSLKKDETWLDMVVKPSGKPTIVEASDKRKAYNPGLSKFAECIE